MVRNVLGEEGEKNDWGSSFYGQNSSESNIFLWRMIQKEPVVTEIEDKSLFGLFALQLYESADVSSAAQLMILVGYITEKNVKEDLLFCG